MSKVMSSWVVSLKQYNTQSRISLEILKRCSSNLASGLYITKEAKWHLWCHCYGNSYTTGPVLIKNKIPRFYRCTFLVPSLKNAAPIFLEIFLIECCTVLVEPPMTSPLFSFTYYTNVNISTKKKDIPKRKAPFFFTLKSLSNKQQSFFTS